MPHRCPRDGPPTVPDRGDAGVLPGLAPAPTERILLVYTALGPVPRIVSKLSPTCVVLCWVIAFRVCRGGREVGAEFRLGDGLIVKGAPRNMQPKTRRPDPFCAKLPTLAARRERGAKTRRRRAGPSAS